MGKQISKPYVFNVGNHIFLLDEELERKEDKIKHLAYISEQGGIPTRSDTSCYLWLPISTAINSYRVNMVVSCPNMKIYLKGDSAGLFAESGAVVIGTVDADIAPKVDDIHVTDFVEEDLTDTSVETWKVPPCN